MPGGWEGGSLTSLCGVIRQMHTIGGMLVIYTTLGIVGYLLLFPVLRILVYMKALTSHFKLTFEKKRLDTFE